MMRIRRYRSSAFSWATMLCAVALFAAGCGGIGGGDAESEDENDLGTLRVTTVVPESVLFIGVQAADALGTWDDTSLDVEVIQSTQTTFGQLMASGEADIGLSAGPGALANIGKGLEAKLVASAATPWLQLYVAGNDLNAEDVKDLKGATFGSTGKGSAGEYSADQLADSLGWSQNDYKKTTLSNVQSLSAALESGSIDAFAWSSTYAYTLEAKGMGTVVGDAKDYVPDSVFEIFSVMDDVIEDRPKAVAAFFEGYFKAVKKIQKNPQLAIDVLVNDWGANPEAAKRSVEHDIPELSTDGKISMKQLNELASVAEVTTGTTIEKPKDHFTYWGDIGK